MRIYIKNLLEGLIILAQYNASLLVSGTKDIHINEDGNIVIVASPPLYFYLKEDKDKLNVLGWEWTDGSWRLVMS